jgi:hypothetical protein
VTDIGQRLLDGRTPQPYDVDNFLREFASTNPTAHPIILEYVDEAVRTFIHGCYKSSSVMIGCASEKAVLELYGKFEISLTDPCKATMFKKFAKRALHTKFRLLKGSLDRMVSAGKFGSSTLEDIITVDFPGIYDLIRRNRNQAGHPELFAGADADTIFLNLRCLSEYTRKLYLLIDHFNSNPADW